jgi:hypothetical protein
MIASDARRAVSRLKAAPHQGHAPTTVAAIWRLAAAGVRLVTGTAVLAGYWAWARWRATVAYRRELRRAGLPPAAVARLTKAYGDAGGLRQVARMAMGRRR